MNFVRSVIAPRPWTDEEKERLREVWPDPELTIRIIAASMNRTADSIERTAKLMGLGNRRRRGASPDAKPLVKAVAEAIEIPRNCLNCGRPFVAPTRFLRLCELHRNA